MGSGLSRAVGRCQARRLWATAAAAPLPAAVAVLLVVLAPIGLVRLGRTVGRDLADAIGAAGVADALLLGPMLAAAVAGAAVAASLPGRSALGQQVGTAPVGRVHVVVAGALVPAALGAVVMLPSLIALCVGVGLELPGGSPAGLALAVAVLAGLPVGAIAAECAFAIASGHGHARRSLVAAAPALLWIVPGLAFGTPRSGPFALVVASVRGSGSPWVAFAVAAAVGTLLFLAWIALAANRPEQRQRRTASRRSLVPRGRAALPGAVAALLGRRADLRLATAGALGFGIAGTAVAVLAAAPPPTPFLLASTTALLGSIVSSLAVCGVLLRGRWLWIGSPCRVASVVTRACVIGTTGTVVPVVAIGLGAALVAGASRNAVGVLSVLVAVGVGVGLTAGALVPWSGGGLGDQLSSFTGLAVVAIATAFSVGLVAPRLVALGLPGPGVALLVGVSSLAIGRAAITRRLREAR